MHRFGDAKIAVITAAAAIGVVFGVIFLRKVFSGDNRPGNSLPGPRTVSSQRLVEPADQRAGFRSWCYSGCGDIWRGAGHVPLSRLDLVLLPNIPIAPQVCVNAGCIVWAIVVLQSSLLLSAHVGLEIVKAGVAGRLPPGLAAFLALTCWCHSPPCWPFRQALPARDKG